MKGETYHEDHRVRAIRDISFAINAVFPLDAFHVLHFTGIEESPLEGVDRSAVE